MTSHFVFWELAYFFALVAISYAYSICRRQGNSIVSAPYSGSKYSWFARLGFFLDARSIVDLGYSQFKNELFKICGNDVIVLPHKYLDEIRRIPERKLNAMKANLANMQSNYTIMDVLGTTKIFISVIQTKLTPKLGALVPVVRDELDFSMKKEMPLCDSTWAVADIFPLLHQVVGQTSARIFVGLDLCRNEHWLHAAEGYTNNVFKTTIALRLAPSWAKTLVSLFIPPWWKVHYHFYRARRILVPFIKDIQENRLVTKASPTILVPTMNKGLQKTIDTPNTLVEMLINEAEGRDMEPLRIAAVVLSLTLASNHTTTMALTEALYDICAYPEYIGELREEVQCAIQEGGGWYKATLTKMRKLDSFMKESQRMNPPSYMGYKRRVMEPITLSDGLQLPVQAHIELAIISIQNDHTENPHEFDGLRYYKMRLNPGEAHKHQFATTNSHTLHFGHGQHSCPGRFMASTVIKMVLASLLLEYDMKFPEGQGRPKSIPAFEYSFPDPAGKIMFKKRRVV